MILICTRARLSTSATTSATRGLIQTRALADNGGNFPQKSYVAGKLMIIAHAAAQSLASIATVCEFIIQQRTTTVLRLARKVAKAYLVMLPLSPTNTMS